MKIFTNADKAIKALNNGARLRVGKITNQDGEIKPSDEIVRTKTGQIKQRGVERIGCDFDLAEASIKYEIDNYNALKKTGRNLDGGNTSFCIYLD